jgi:Orn/Lys/Arg decarboxylase, C-terminal domain
VATTTIPSAPKGKRHASEGSAAEAAPPDTGWRDLALSELSVSNPTIPQPMLDYFMAFQESFNRFPGFNYEVQGVYQERIDDRIKFYTYAVRH